MFQCSIGHSRVTLEQSVCIIYIIYYIGIGFLRTEITIERPTLGKGILSAIEEVRFLYIAFGTTALLCAHLDKIGDGQC